MTAKQLYENVLIELNKVNAPTLLLSDFNYIVMKGVQLYLNKRYTVYEMDQQTSDDLRVLAATALLDVENCDSKYYNGKSPWRRGVYESNLPDDYFHILSCTCIFEPLGDYKCDKKGNYVEYSATRMSADIQGVIGRNYYMRPSFKHPYYFIHNINKSTSLPTNLIELDKDGNLVDGTDQLYTNSIFEVTNDTITLDWLQTTELFNVVSKNNRGEYLQFYVESKSFDNDVTVGLDSVSIVFGLNNSLDQRVFYLTIRQSQTDKKKILTVVLKGKVVEDDYEFRVKTSEECKDFNTYDQYNEADETHVAIQPTHHFTVNTKKLKSIGVRYPANYILSDVTDVLGQSVMFAFNIKNDNDFGYVYRSSRSYLNNAYTFKFTRS